MEQRTRAAASAPLQAEVASRRREFDRLTPGDLMMLWPEDFGWREDIGALATLSGGVVAGGSVRIEAVREHVETRLHLVPRLRQRLLVPPFGLGRPLWIDAQDFDVRNHVNLQALPDNAGEQDLLAIAADLFGRPFDWSRPLWEMWLLPGLADGRVGLLIKLHHTLADAQASLVLLSAFLDLRADEPRGAAAPPWEPQPVPSSTALLRDNVRRRTSALSHAVRSLAHPVRGARQLGHTLYLLRQMVGHEKAPVTSLNRRVSYAQRTFALVRADVPIAKRIAHAEGGTLNDTLLCAVAGGLRELLASRGEPLERVIANVPVSLHSDADGTATGNEVGVVFVGLPVAATTETARLRAITQASALAKQTAYVPPTGALMANRTIQRLFWRNMRRQRFANIYVANVFGPPMPLYFSGARLEDVFPLMSMIGNVTVGIAAISYAGQLNISVMGDLQTSPDLAVLADGMTRTLADLAAAYA